MKINLKDLAKKDHQARMIQPILALTLALIPTLIFGYTPGEQERPYDKGGRSGSLYPTIESAEVLPLLY